MEPSASAPLGTEGAVAFPGHPAQTIAVRKDGVFLVVPGVPGDLGALDGTDNPAFYNKDHKPLGPIEVSGLTDMPQTCAFFAIANLSKVRGAAYLVVWYLTRYASAPTFEVRSVNPDTLGPLLLRLGMEWMADGKDMAGATQEVCERARKKCHSHHWVLLDEA